ncbi:MAG: hypothetical protein EBS42_13810 [Caulobacteraceae bacterium]|nr:hypothetical protein [Caulobacteraceae bacterium]
MVNTLGIGEMCTVVLDHSKVVLPEFEVPSGETPDTWLAKQVHEGLAWRYGSGVTQEHRSRVAYELRVIAKTGYARYFLIVQDYVMHARKSEVMAVPRGSVAGSLCVYALGICDIDPVKLGRVAGSGAIDGGMVDQKQNAAGLETVEQGLVDGRNGGRGHIAEVKVVVVLGGEDHVQRFWIAESAQ